MKLLITGGAGFIGSAVVRHVIAKTNWQIINVDKLTYAGNLASIADVASDDRYRFCQVDICARAALENVFENQKPDAVLHLAAESHVDRSIDGAADFVQTNMVGTHVLLDVARTYWQGLNAEKKNAFRFHHVSTDEVYGDIEGGGLFREDTPYAPNSPYAATKAGADHLVRAYHRTYGLPCLVTNTSNNYGPYQYPEKLIPLMILNALAGRPLPVYGDGKQVRDWLYVDDHVAGLLTVLRQGQPGETYNIGGHNERENIHVVETICGLLEDAAPGKPNGVKAYYDLITFVKDRPGHDRRYAIDASKVIRELGWEPRESFESGLEKTVRWYIDNVDWCKTVPGDARRRVGLG